jgi:L-ascorbate oxidase
MQHSGWVDFYRIAAFHESKLAHSTGQFRKGHYSRSPLPCDRFACCPDHDMLFAWWLGEMIPRQRPKAPSFHAGGSANSIGLVAAMHEWTWSAGNVDRMRMFAMTSATAAAALIFGATAALAGAFVEPPVFASSRGVLDLLMIAQPQPVPSIIFNPPDQSPPLNPIGWVYTVCPRSVSLPGNQCPASSPTVSNYGGVRLALQKGDSLKIRLVNRLPALDPIKVNRSADPGGDNLPLNLTNLHTHGLIVPARAPTLADPTFGDYVFVQIYNSANGTPVPLSTHQHGSIVKDYVDYRIDIPANHPSGPFWFHPHVHGIALNQVSSGLSGIISVGAAGDYAFGDISEIPFPESNVRNLVLKDMQVLAASNGLQFQNGTAPVANGEVLNQQASPFCNQFQVFNEPPRLGSCTGISLIHTQQGGGVSTATWGSGGGIFPGAVWYFTVSGQQYPTINVTEADGELWRFTNASGSLSYDLQLTDNATKTPMVMQLVSVDGVSIDIPPGTPVGTVAQAAGARFNVVACPNVTTTLSSAPVCIDGLVMMPSSRAEVYVTYRDQNGNIVTPPAGASATLNMVAITMGPVGDPWPAVQLASVQFNQTGVRTIVRSAIDVHGDALAANRPGGIFHARVPNAAAAPLPTGCKPLPAGHRRRVFFGFPDTSNPDVFGLGYEEVDENDVPVPGTELPLMAFDPSINTICIPLGPGQTPVTETWELVNLATENHNFHIHQTRFRYVEDTAPTGSLLAPALDPSVGAGVMEDNLPLPVATTNVTAVVNDQYGYCTIAQWRSGDCTSTPIVIQNTFTQIGHFVYHCHILAHEDGGMMAAIEVVPSPSPNPTNTHDYNGDGKSDVAWRDTSGNVAIWEMNGTTILNQANSFVTNVPANWSIVGTGDYNGDGKSDILWQDTSGNVAIWEMNGTTVLNQASSFVANVPTNWSIVATGDFNGDGMSDILWRDSSGNVAIWEMNGTSVLNASDSFVANVPTNWSIVGSGDYNGDGKSDIVWQDGSGNVAIWEMIGATVLNASTSFVANVPGNWSIAGAGDFNGDGKSDILWHDTTGNVAIWEMNGTAILNQATSFVANVPGNWSIVGSGDYNGDGVSDVVWHDAGGNVAIWEMNGTAILNQSTSFVANVGGNWSIQDPQGN